MTRIYTLLIGITLGLTTKAIYATPSQHLFTTPPAINLALHVTEPNPAFISLDASRVSNKIILKWQIAENEAADQFEVEKSTDGTNFTTAGLVFGTDRLGTGEYMFYEKSNGNKMSYRIKLVNKDRKAAYSAVIEVAQEKTIPQN